ncbi:MAG: hypothetical protein RIM23_16705 [Coleofasciculus sp. G3-WIS-01]
MSKLQGLSAITSNCAIAPSLNNFLVANATVFLFRQLKPWRWEICR